MRRFILYSVKDGGVGTVAAAEKKATGKGVGRRRRSCSTECTVLKMARGTNYVLVDL